jgi:diguanylate cyclase
MIGTYTPWLVLLSILVAIFVSHTALSLSSRVAQAKNSSSSGLWLTGGAIAMGTGIWSMHFVGMLAFSLPIQLSYDAMLTLASLIIAIFISGFALWVASSPEINTGYFVFAGVLLGLGISAMHYTGMAAIEIQPIVTYEMSLVLASVGIAIGASFAALWLFFHLRHGRSFAMSLARIGAAFVMGLAISGMHYTAMAASQFDARSFCFGKGTVDARWLGNTIAVVAVAVLSLTTLALYFDSRRTRPVRRHGGSSLRHS